MKHLFLIIFTTISFIFISNAQTTLPLNPNASTPYAYDTIPYGKGNCLSINLRTGKVDTTIYGLVENIFSVDSISDLLNPMLRHLSIWDGLNNQYFWKESDANYTGQNFPAEHGYPLIMSRYAGRSPQLIIDLETLGSSEVFDITHKSFGSDSCRVRMVFFGGDNRFFGLWLWHIQSIVSGQIQTALFSTTDILNWMNTSDSLLFESFPKNGTQVQHNYDNLMFVMENAPTVGFNKESGYYEIYLTTGISSASSVNHSATQSSGRAQAFFLRINPFEKNIDLTEFSPDIWAPLSVHYTQLSKSTDFPGNQSLFICSSNKMIVDNLGWYSPSMHGIYTGRIHARWYDDSTNVIDSFAIDLLSPGTLLYDSAYTLLDTNTSTLNFVVVDGVAILPSNGEVHSNGLPFRTILVGMRNLNGPQSLVGNYVFWEVCITADPVSKVIEQHYVTRKETLLPKFQTGNGYGSYGMYLSDTYLYISNGADQNPNNFKPNLVLRYKIEDDNGNPLYGCRSESIILGESFLEYDVELDEETQDAVNTWKLTEQGVGTYTVQHSLNAIHFTNLAEVDAEGDGPQEYLWLHETPACDMNYYRVRMNRLDGSTLYTDIKSVTVDCPDNSISIFPNPVAQNGSFTIRLSDATAQAQYRVYSVVGQELVVNKSFIGLTEVPMGNYSAGVYIVQVTMNDGTTKTEKLILQE